MGFEVTQDVVRVHLRNTIFDGAQADVEMCTVEEWAQISIGGETTLLKVFQEHLLNWNLEVNGEPVGTDAKSIAAIPNPSLVLSLAMGYLSGAKRVHRDRPRDPSDREMNGAGPVEMETL